jgi:pyridoxamine 5'-phosphate oxidase
MPPAAVDEYFHSRPMGSQVGACVSQQSRPLESRAVLQTAVAKFAKEHADGAIERPAVWRGYVINPVRIEFWADGVDRLHDRFLFTRSGGDDAASAGIGSSALTSGAAGAGWSVTRLYP